MTGNGDTPEVEHEFGCYCGYVTTLDGPPPTGGVGHCPNCNRKYTITILDGELRVEWSAIFKRVLLLDLDGTVRYAPRRPWPEKPDQVRIFPDVIEKLDEFIEQDFFVVAITNQAGPAMGQARLVDVQQALAVTMQQLYPRLHMVQASFGHDDAVVETFRYRSFLRKPHYGMLAVAEQTMIEEAGIVPDWDRSLIVGDGEADLELARSAHVPFAWAWDFFNRPHPDEGRSPECRYCMGDDEEADPHPGHSGGGRWFHAHLAGSVSCEDQDWFIGRYG